MLLLLMMYLFSLVTHLFQTCFLFVIESAQFEVNVRTWVRVGENVLPVRSRIRLRDGVFVQDWCELGAITSMAAPNVSWINLKKFTSISNNVLDQVGVNQGKG